MVPLLRTRKELVIQAVIGLGLFESVCPIFFASDSLHPNCLSLKGHLDFNVNPTGGDDCLRIFVALIGEN